MTKERTKTTERYRNITIIVSACFCALVLAIVLFMNIKSSQDQYEILETSVKNELIATSIAAREFIDINDFLSYKSAEDTEADGSDYDRTLADLRHLADSVGAQYIYALKQIDEKYYFVYDTDSVDEVRFEEYDPSPVHLQAFEGRDAADVMNVSDEYGNFNTGAVPLWHNGEVVGVISVDLNDIYIQESNRTEATNSIILAIAMVATLGIMMALVIVLTRRLRKMQSKLERMAHFDIITGLPNRQYLMEYLTDLTTNSKEPFAMLFIDLDNFKKVNDNAGHDAGDELLRHIAEYLDTASENSMSFRPVAGKLNIAARVGGDEFIEVVSGVKTEAEAAAFAQKLLEGFTSNKLDKYIEKYQVGLSIGVALYPYHTEDFNVLIKYADIAMYYAKKSGKNNYCIYTDEMNQG